MNLDPRHLVQLATVVELGTFQAAADALGVTQPALTRTIQILEQRVGSALFDRTARRAVPTTVGLELAAIGQSIRSATLRARDISQSFSRGQAGRLRIGATPLVAGIFLAPIIRNFLTAHDSVTIALSMGLVGELNERLINRDIDLIVGPIGLFERGDDLAYETLFDDEIGFFCCADHPLLRCATIGAAELSKVRWIMPPSGSLFRFQTDSALEELGVEQVRVALETLSVEASVEIARKTDFLTPLSALTISSNAIPGLARLPIHSDRLRRPLGVVSRKSGLQPLVRIFINAIVDSLREHEPSPQER
ncbi:MULTISPECIES: LysR family transcriptional regulator [unclassified Beijerinckia]|uniref:LysR family transcriptional regulator n=1 Tax=unclassified Beijerinckia TaxID=2638183 RepID=UPI0008959E17|nr:MULTISPECIES: LysR family transcriptional regulator [unclassified Beijerinckia]MDH7795830.1 DNA-binding transcriptional LysR family regulator [Beijerinckia sp. GAS462]SEC18209.1 DNA-binding transcriptional regulator, LysR family [Beijerinckia sp. 28-YEA-48]